MYAIRLSVWCHIHTGLLATKITFVFTAVYAFSFMKNIFYFSFTLLIFLCISYSGLTSFYITLLCSVSVFGELWKLEPLAEERKSRWQREMDWLLSPTNYMVELVPAKQNGANGRMLEVLKSEDLQTSIIL